MSNPFEEMAEEAASTTSIPSDAGMKRLSKMAGEMVELETFIKTQEDAVKQANIRLWDLKTREMPDLMSELSTDHHGVPGTSESEKGWDLVLENYAKANIVADWPEERREAGFAHLEELGAGDLINNTITVSFPRGHHAERKEWLEKVRGLNLSFDPPEIVQGRAVPWNTLTAYVKEQIKSGNPDLVLEKLGAVVGLIVNIKKRK